MKEEKRSLLKKVLKIFWLFFALFSIIVWFPKVDQLLCKEYKEVSQYLSLDDSWEVTINGTNYHNVSLEQFQFEMMNKGDNLVMERKLPKDFKMEQATLRLHIRQSVIKMYIDDEVIYEYGYERMKQNKTVGSGTVFINFPEQYEGKNLKIEMQVTEDNSFAKFDSIRIYEWKNAYKALITENRVPMFLGSFLSVFGVAILIITIFAVLMSRKYIRVFCIAAFSICIGLWILCYYDVIFVYSIPVYSASLLNFMAFYLTPIPLIIYMYENVKNLKNKVFIFIYWVLFGLQIIFNVVMLTLHTLDIVHCVAGLKYLHILMIMELVYLTIVLLLNLKNSNVTDRLYVIGMLVVAICMGYDLGSYYLNKYYDNPLFQLKGVSGIGLMIFIFIMIFSFYINLTQKLMKDTERKSLIQRAYTDEMTELHNRRYCTEYMEKINENGEENYTIICFDLNNLKETNDTYGHTRGDLLIQSAAQVIKDTFSKKGVVGRMGGDEFIAILKDLAEEDLKQLIQGLNENIRSKNQEEPKLHLSIAYGYAVSNEESIRDTEKVYQIADRRMYEHKKEMKGTQL